MKSRTDTLVVADVHLNGDDPGSLEEFLVFLQRESAGCSTVVFLGDLFDLWLGPPLLQEPHHRRLAESLAGLRQEGVSLAYAEGNRDLFVARYFQGRLFDQASEGAILLNRGGKRFVLVHGDRLNRIDYNYRIWNSLVRNRVVQLLLRVLPTRWTLRASSTLERSLRKTNRRFRTYFPSRQCERYARCQFALGVDVVVLGHFHQRLYFDFRQPEDEIGGEVYVVPDWLNRRAALRIDDSGNVHLVKSNSLAKNSN